VVESFRRLVSSEESSRLTREAGSKGLQRKYSAEQCEKYRELVETVEPM